MPILLLMIFISFALLVFRDKICLWIKDRVTTSHTSDQYGPPASRTPAPRVTSYTCDKNSDRIERLTYSHQDFQQLENVEKDAALVLEEFHQMIRIENTSFSNRTTCGHTATCTNYGKSFCPMSKGDSCDGCVYFSLRISEYGAQVRGHFRRCRNGKYSWVKSHRRRI